MFDHPVERGMPGDAPVEAVGAEIHQAPAAVGEVLQRVQHFQAVVLRMRARHDAAIRLQAIDPFVVQVLVGDDVAVEALGRQPVGDVGIGVELPQVALRPHVEDGPQAGGMGNAAAVAMQIVGREAEGMGLFQELVSAVDGGELRAAQLVEAPAGVHLVVGVGEVARGRHQEDEARGRLALGRAHEQRRELLEVALLQMHAVDRALQVPSAGGWKSRSSSCSRRDRRRGNGSRRNAPACASSSSRCRSSSTPVMPRVGRLTVCPLRRLREESITQVPPTSCEKSQSATARSGGGSSRVPGKESRASAVSASP